MHRSVAEKRLRRLCPRLGLTPMTPHQLRHPHASPLISEGLPVTDVAKRLGHSAPAVTVGVCAQTITKREDAATAAISRTITDKTR